MTGRNDDCFVCYYSDVCILVLLSQLPCRTGPQTTHARYNVEHNKDCLIYISHYRFSLVISGLTKILQKVNETVSCGQKVIPIIVNSCKYSTVG